MHHFRVSVVEPYLGKGACVILAPAKEDDAVGAAGAAAGADAGAAANVWEASVSASAASSAQVPDSPPASGGSAINLELVEQPRPRGRINEILAVFLSVGSEDRQYFRQHLRQEAYNEDLCEVCLEPLCGYKDDSCVKCRNVVVCRSCVQVFDPEALEAQVPNHNLLRFKWELLGGSEAWTWWLTL